MGPRRTGRRAATIAAAAFCAAACSGTSSAPIPAQPDHASTASVAPLRINLASPPERWRTVATFKDATAADRRGIPWDPQAVPGDPNRVRWSTQGATLDITMLGAWERRYAVATDHVIAIQVRSVQVARGHVYLWLGVAGTPTNASGGTLLLELDGHGNVASLDRIDAPGGDSRTKRMFYVASNGTVYQWYATPTKAELRVRP